MLDIRGETVNIGDKVLCTKYKRRMQLGRFEKITKTSFLIRLTDNSTFSVSREIDIPNPAYNWKTNSAVPYYLRVVNDTANSCILKVEDSFTL